MAASHDTITQILTVLLRHLTEAQIREIMLELNRDVEGNSSVRQTLGRLVIATRGYET